MSAAILPHRAHIVRSWHIAQIAPNQWQGRVVSRIDQIDIRTAVGSFYLVHDAVTRGGHCRGLPVRITRELPKRATASAGLAGDF